MHADAITGDAEAPYSTHKAGAAAPRADLIILEDESRARTELATFLEAEGYRVRRAAYAISAIKKVGLYGADVILIDISMGGQFDGIEAARRIQHSHPNKSIIFVTAHAGNPEYARRVEEAGLRIAAWIEKPLTATRKKLLLHVIGKEGKKVSLRRAIANGVTVDVSPLDTLRLVSQYDLDLSEEIADEIEEEIRWRSVLRSKLVGLSEIPPGDAIDLLYLELRTLLQQEESGRDVKGIVDRKMNELRSLQEREAKAMREVFERRVYVKPGSGWDLMKKVEGLLADEAASSED